MLHTSRPNHPPILAPVSVSRPSAPPLTALEQAVNRIVHHAADPWGLLSFGLGMSAFRLARLGAMGIFARTGIFWGARPASILLGLGAESTAMTATHRVGRHYFSKHPVDLWQGFGDEVLATGLGMGLLRGMGALTVGRHWILQQGGMYAGIVIGDGLGQKIGWSEPKSFSNLLSDGLTSLIQFHVSSLGAAHLWGNRFLLLQRQLDQRIQKLTPRSSHPPLLPPQNMALGLLGGGFSALSSAPFMERLRPWVAMAPSDGDGNVGGGRIIRFPSRLVSDTEAPAPRKDPNPRVTLSRIASATRDAEKNVELIHSSLDELLVYSELYARHRQLQRLSDSAAEQWFAKIDAVTQSFQGHLREAIEVARSLDELSLLGRQVNSTAAKAFFAAHRQHRDLMKVKEDLQMKVDGLAKFLSQQEPPEAFLQRDGILLLLQSTLSPHPKYPLPISTDASAKSLTYQGVSGMLLGIGAKEAFRTPAARQPILDPVSSRRQDWERVSEMLHNFVIGGSKPGPRHHLLLDMEKTEGQFPMWRFYLNKEVPLEGWFGVTLPILVARYGGHFAQIRAQTLALEPDLPEVFRPWTVLTQWFLTKALHSKGTPTSWMENLPDVIKKSPGIAKALGEILALSSGKEIYLSRMKEKFSSLGEAAVVPYSLVIFLRSYHSPTMALGLARRTPEPWREEILTLTGALLGAYYGAAFSNRGFLESVTGRWRNSQRENFEDARKYIQTLLIDLQNYWGNEMQVRKVRALDVPDRVIKPSVLQDNFASRLDLFHTELQGRFLGLLEYTSSLVRRSQISGVTAGAWSYGERKLKDVRYEALQFQENLKAFMEDCERVLEIHPGHPKIPHRIATRLLKQVEQGLTQLQVLAELWKNTRPRRGEVFLNEAKAEKFNHILIQIRDVIEVLVLLNESPINKRRFERGELKKIHEASLTAAGPLQIPEFGEALHWESRNPWGHAIALAGEFSGRPLSTLSFEGILATFYKQIGWRPQDVHPSFHGNKNISLSILSSVLTPAYLEIFRADPTRAYRDLEKIDISPDPQKLEAWRGMTYLTLRLLEGAKPDILLAKDLREILHPPEQEKGYRPSKLGFYMDQLLSHGREGKNPPKDLLKEWRDTLMPADLVAAAYADLLVTTPKQLHLVKHPKLRRLSAMLSEAARLGARVRFP